MHMRFAAGPWHVVAVSLFLGACASSGRGSYAQLADSPSRACMSNPLYCAVAAGKEPAMTMASGAQAANAAASLAAAVKLFEDEHRERVEEVLKRCVEQASAELNLRHFGANPTKAQCSEQVGVDARGQPVTRAMTLGTEKHAAALRCIQERLSIEWPEGFSLEERYRYDPESNKTTLVSEAEAQALLRQGRGKELRGTLRPDVVIHNGNPLQALAVYDLKFPCPGSNFPKWERYPPESPFRDLLQGSVYAAALRVANKVAMVSPIWGIIRQ